ncbi:hypothetical protein CapIbe_009718 [Capra ibex]
MRWNTVVVFESPRRSLVLKLCQKDTLQVQFQEKPYPGIATRERLAQELGIAQSRVQVWFQNQCRRQLKQSRSPSEYVHQEGEAGPTSIPTPLTPSPRPQSSSPGAHPAFPGSASFLEEILAATATWDKPWSPPGAPAGDEGLEAILEACLSHEDYRALLDMLLGSPGPRA